VKPELLRKKLLFVSNPQGRETNQGIGHIMQSQLIDQCPGIYFFIVAEVQAINTPKKDEVFLYG